MSGMVKAKVYDWKDSNMALFGSETDRNVKEAAAATEEAWVGAGSKVGLEIWRINKFKVERWPKENYGKFFSGDSYIIMNTFIRPDEEDFEFDLHFWIGKHSTQDEYGTAAYKTVELDTLLKDKPVQHREVMNYESDLFKGYFKSLTYLNGGVETGFHHVEKVTMKPTLFHIFGSKKFVQIEQVGLNKQNLDSHDVYVLVTEKTVFQWNGQFCNKDEKLKASMYVVELRRNGKGLSVIEDPDQDEDFLAFFSDSEPLNQKADDIQDVTCSKLFRLTDSSGSLKVNEEVSSGKIKKSMLDSSDVFIIDKKNQCFVWVGKNASQNEKKNWALHSHNYLKTTKHPLKPVTCISEGKEPAGLFDSEC